MNQRDIVRIRREHGIKFFALPLVALLGIAVVADQWLGEYGEHRTTAQELRDTQERQRAVLDLQAQVTANEERLKPLFAASEPRLYISETPAESAQAMRQQLMQLLQSLYLDQVVIDEVAELPAGQVTQLKATVRFMGVPQQLPRLQSLLAQQPQQITTDLLEVKVIPDPQRGGQQLSVRATFSALHVKTLPAPAQTGASQPTNSKT
jgi:hypothetical protein